MNESGTFGQRVIQFHHQLKPPTELPEGVSWINNFDTKETQVCFESFYTTFFDDYNKRLFLFGINPGRFGAGLTGVGFTDPVYLEERCGVPNPFPKKHELSSHFIYRVISEYGSVNDFYKRHYITALSPVGLLKDEKNYNYYDDNKTLESVEPFVVDCIKRQLEFGSYRDRALCIGKGKNYRYFSELNRKYGWFDRIIPLPHPRWVMQYNRNKIDRYINEYLDVLS